MSDTSSHQKDAPHVQTVMIVEDEAALQEAARIKFEQAGVRVVAAYSGEQALEMLRTERPDLVWLDLLLPGMNGLEVLRKIRENPAIKDLPVIIVSVSGGEEKIRSAFSLDIVDYIIKSQHKIENIVQRAKEVMDAHSH